MERRASPSHRRREFSLVFLAVFGALGAPVAKPAEGSFIAYEVIPGTTGNQAFGGALGMDFDVERDITVTRLGVFDDGSDGLSLTITARLYDRATTAELASLEFTSEAPGELVGGSRFLELETPLVLGAGFQGVIVAEGYGAGEQVANSQGNPDLVNWTTNDGECAVAFVGGGRFGEPGVFPAGVDAGPAARYAAGTFEYETALTEGGIAYIVPQGTAGNQAFGGALGMDFDVLAPIDVTRLGVFDDGSDGLNLTITARLYDRVSEQELASLVFAADDSAELIDGSRFKDLDPPLALSAGFQGTIAAEGYGDTERLGNPAVSPIEGLQRNNGGCLLRFVGSGRYAVNPGEFPATPDTGAPNRYASGTFAFRPSTVEPPDPPTDLTAVASDERVELSWNAPAAGSFVEGYNVYQTRPGPVTLVNPAVITATEFTVAGLINGVEHCYVARAVGTTGLESEDSAVACATPPCDVMPAEVVTAYQVPEGTVGNQDFDGAMGMDFDVNADIAVTRLGVFDGGSDGLALPLTARLYDRESGIELVSLEFTPEDPGELVGGSRFKTLAVPVCLPAGFQATIVAEGYGETEMNGNQGEVSLGLSTENLSCTIALVGSRFGPAGSFPVTFNNSPVVDAFAAGTFEFGPTSEVEPSILGGTAYLVPPETTGNQDFGGALGMDFNVESDIEITHLGVFDDASDGLTLPITARLYDRDSQEELARIDFTPGDPGELVGGSRFKSLAEAVCLIAGSRATMVAEGYGEGELLANSGFATVPIPKTWTRYDGGCLLTFVGAGRWSANPGEFPVNVDQGPQDRYAAGTFRFQPSSCAPPPPNPPQGLTARAADGEVTLSWQPPGGVTPAASYKIFRASGMDPFAEIAEVGETEYNDGGLPNGVEVCYRVRTVAEDGQESEDSRAVCATPGALVPGRIIAYEVPSGTQGNASSDDAFGMDFDVELEILVTRLGVFDDGSDGLQRTITVKLFGRSMQVEVAALEFSPEEPGVVIGGSRFKNLDPPIPLRPGFQGTVVAEGYGDEELVGIGTYLPTNPGPCSILFTGSRRDVPGGFPATETMGLHPYAAATFEFEARGLLDPGMGGIAYEVPAGLVGNQAFDGTLGMDFNVQHDIRVTHLGVFDDGSDGLNLPIPARLYDRDTEDVLAQFDFTPEEPGELVDGSRLKALESPVELPAGFHGTIVAEGYGETEKLGNQGAVDLGLTTNSGGCLIAFVNGGRYGLTPGGFPDVPDGGPANRYAAGTFQFEPILPPSQQVPGDCNQDGTLDISDAICVFGFLFLGTPEVLPCGDGSSGDPANVTLMDWQPDGAVDISDGVGLLQFLFSGGSPHPSAVPGMEREGCLPIAGCPDNDECL